MAANCTSTSHSFSESSWKNKLSADQVKWCEQALRQMKSKDPNVISREFAKIEARTAIPDGSIAISQASINRTKNRYLDILPFDHNRVVLQGTSDYINASFITGSASNIFLPKFIAAQGPLKSTIVDFWEMVMQYRCPVIVMLTGLVEGQQEKCAPYFPAKENEEQMYGRLKIVTRKATYSRHSIAKRVIEIHCTQGKQDPFVVTHFEYLDWPDHGVPTSTRSIREIFRCNYCIPVDSGPFIIHCSAGVGRTGTYIAIDHCLRRVLNGDLTATDMEGTVQFLRQQRHGMVQRRAQYHFCYAAVIHELEEQLHRSKIV